MDLYVSNLPPMSNSYDLRKIFKGYGTVLNVLWFKERGFAIVKMENSEAAEKALKFLNGKDVRGVALNVKKANELSLKRQRPKRNIPETDNAEKK